MNLLGVVSTDVRKSPYMTSCDTEMNRRVLKTKEFLEYPSDQHRGLISEQMLLDRTTAVMTAVSITLFVCLFFLLSFLTPVLSITGCLCLPPFLFLYFFCFLISLYTLSFSLCLILFIFLCFSFISLPFVLFS